MAARRNYLIIPILLFLLYLIIPSGRRSAGYREDLGGNADVDFAPPEPRTLFRHKDLADRLLKEADDAKDGRVVVTLSSFLGTRKSGSGKVEATVVLPVPVSP